ncbi:heme d1 biosynthesis radical SAM protein NirJ [Hahella sp. CCB-MM4]|uniref:heme d1 biosynthesis radical SAM protein NirJ n=1 Tax=Hahella sp. (strain CCB-MM4) TaxID=1926491 RepID=UPI000B9AC61D|nr:heme d1 biosynthesis radical SAM protein NirJ [Hahella sp. CCB-MM4]OZG72976.1 heme d1 biosynthesis radical SAM protein NirJ [Hahella sp. CCB-MM4]
MFRITQYMRSLTHNEPFVPRGKPSAPVVIWNLIRRCNLTCRHCYSISADIDFPGELSTDQIYNTLDDLREMRVPAVILSGGEPLLRKDIFLIGAYAKSLGLYVGLSSNGTLMDKNIADQIARTGFDYVGVSIDGLESTHDEFRQKQGCFKSALEGIERCKEAGVKVGLRFTLTENNAEQLPAILDLMHERDIDKFYLSHLNYAGRGLRNRKRDAFHQTTREAMERLFDRAHEDLLSGRNTEYVTGNNDADGPCLLAWAARRYPDRMSELKSRLEHWGGNASGIGIANIDNTGEVHPDTFWWNHHLGNVKERPFSDIWRNTQDPFMLGLRSQPRPLQGRCQSCAARQICNGNTRVRGYTQSGGDFWAEDPGCYLTDEEINLPQKIH